uniref:Transposase Tc1-like domain-containing protein n=1 Tax=Scleropages formosus TaxID=113540 RepID=A0A8C9TZU4_SCLFO
MPIFPSHRASQVLKAQHVSADEEIVTKAKVSVSTVSYTIKRHLETGGNSNRKRSGRPKATAESEDKFLRVNRLRDRQLTGQQLRAQLNTGFTGWVAVRKPLLRWQNKRLAWAMKHRHWTTEDWKKVLWMDESKFEIFNSSQRVFVCHRNLNISLVRLKQTLHLKANLKSSHHWHINLLKNSLYLSMNRLVRPLTRPTGWVVLSGETRTKSLQVPSLCS